MKYSLVAGSVVFIVAILIQFTLDSKVTGLLSGFLLGLEICMIIYGIAGKPNKRI